MTTTPASSASDTTSEIDIKPGVDALALTTPTKKTPTKATKSPTKRKTPVKKESISEGEDEQSKADSSDLESSSPTKKAKGQRGQAKSTPKGRSMPGDFTPEKKATLNAKIWLLGAGSLNKAEAAEELGLSVKQIDNAICSGRKGNLRDQMIRRAAGEDL